MIHIHGANLLHTLLLLYQTIASGREISPRSSPCRNVRNVAVTFDSRRPVITDFASRKFNFKYAKQEWLWYVRADNTDDTIEQYASAWKKLKQDDGTYFSNYGQYIFGPTVEGGSSQFIFCLNELVKNPDTRRASMVLLQPYHMFPDNTDMVCTYAINFTIEDGKLHMTVMMRSNDVIFGFTNDAFCFWNLHVMMYTAVKKHLPHLELGLYTHMANSMHVYEKHYGMIGDIIRANGSDFTWHDVPMPTFEEVQAMANGKVGEGDYSKWLQA